ncbi:MAG: hypothetical protein AWU59_1019 [Methanolobus sp. T82-4]|nr:MAG: hypothetical protein AWU59_1019 [Methanolobus sp. T82-4]
MKKETKSLIAILATIVIFLLIFTRIDINSVIEELSKANLFYLAVSVIPMIFAIIIQSQRWQQILRSMGYAIPYFKCLHILMASFPLTSVTPSKAGDVIRGYYLRKEINPTRTIGSVLTERIFDLSVLILFSSIGIIVYGRYEFLFVILMSLLILGVIILILSLTSRFTMKKSIKDKVDNVTHSMRLLLKQKKVLLSILVSSILIWLLAIVQTLCFFYALDIEIPTIFIIGNIPIAIFIGMIPISLGGMGTRDAAIVILFSDYGTPSQLLSIGLIFSFFRYWLLAFVGIPFMKRMI